MFFWFWFPCPFSAHSIEEECRRSVTLNKKKEEGVPYVFWENERRE